MKSWHTKLKFSTHFLGESSKQSQITKAVKQKRVAVVARVQVKSAKAKATKPGPWSSFILCARIKNISSNG